MGTHSALMQYAPMEQIISKARTSLLLDKPFFGSLSMRLKLVEDNDMKYAFGVDGVSLFYNTEMVRKFTFEEVKGVVCHEVLHLVLKHHERRSGRDQGKWDIACDEALNPMVIEGGLVLPEGALLNPMFKGMSAEQIYEALPDSPQGGQGGQGGQQGGNDPGQQQGPGPADFGGVFDKPGDAPQSADGKSWEAAAQEAMRGADAGGLSGDLAAKLGDILVPPPKWQEVLREYMTKISRDDFSWSKPNKRYISSGLYLPDAYSEQMGELVIAIDVSGSVDRPLLAAFLGEVQALAEEITFEDIHVVHCNTAITSEHSYQSGEEISTEVRAGGGTRFRPVFDWIEKKGINPEVLLYFTDLACTDFPAEEPGYQVLWAEPEKVSSYRREPPFGVCLKISE